MDSCGLVGPFRGRRILSQSGIYVLFATNRNEVCCNGVPNFGVTFEGRWWSGLRRVTLKMIKLLHILGMAKRRGPVEPSIPIPGTCRVPIRLTPSTGRRAQTLSFHYFAPFSVA